MAASVTHKFTSVIADGTDDTQVRPSNWNDLHTVIIAPGDIGAEPANANLQTHVGTVSGNPHGATAAMVGADASGTAAAAVTNHTTAIDHGPIVHTNRASLDLVTGSGATPLWNGSVWPGGGAALTTVAPQMDGTQAVGVEVAASHGDHVHPTDTTLLSKSGGTIAGGLTINTGSATTVIAGTTITMSNNTSSVGYPVGSLVLEASGNFSKIYPLSRTGLMVGSGPNTNAASLTLQSTDSWPHVVGFTLTGGARDYNAAGAVSTVSGSSAKYDSTINLTGGGISIAGGSGASSSVGAATGGDVTIGGGAGYGTGTQGNVIIAAVRGAVGVGVIAPVEKLSIVDGGNVSMGNLGVFTGATNTIIMKHGTAPGTNIAGATQVTSTASGLSIRDASNNVTTVGGNINLGSGVIYASQNPQNVIILGVGSHTPTPGAFHSMVYGTATGLRFVPKSTNDYPYSFDMSNDVFNVPCQIQIRPDSGNSVGISLGTANLGGMIGWNDQNNNFNSTVIAPLTNSPNSYGIVQIVSYGNRNARYNNNIALSNVNPKFRVYSGTTASTSVTQYVQIYHDATNGNISVASGKLNLTATETVNSGPVTATQYKLSSLNTAPQTSGDTGTLGEIRVTADFIFVCTATNTWVRAALATW